MPSQPVTCMHNNLTSCSAVIFPKCSTSRCPLFRGPFQIFSNWAHEISNYTTISLPIKCNFSLFIFVTFSLFHYFFICFSPSLYLVSVLSLTYPQFSYSSFLLFFIACYDPFFSIFFPVLSPYIYLCFFFYPSFSDPNPP